jgi:uncharacterized protein YprB with RNaseH-like and TPR domain
MFATLGYVFLWRRGKDFEGFQQSIRQSFQSTTTYFCGHNAKEFDIPFLARRMINQIALPDKLNLFGKKPWEIPHLDTLELWKFGITSTLL